MKRKEFIKKSSIFGLGTALLPKTAVFQMCDLTTDDILGPYYIENTPTRIVIASPDEPGDRLFITGTVFANDCETVVSGAMVEVWHANDDGCYSVNQECDTGNPDDDDFNLRGKIFTDEIGQYGFETILAGHYGSRPKHIHYKITHPDGSILVSQLYFEGDPFCDSDPWCSDAEDRIIPLEIEPDGLHGVFDIILDSTFPGVISGDINLDSSVDILDIVTLVNVILYGDTLTDMQILAADINSDGLLDVLDIVGIVNIILGSSRQTFSTVTHSELIVQNGKVKLNCNGYLAGLQLQLSGDYKIHPESLPNGWELYHHNGTVLMINTTGTQEIPEALFTFSGTLNIDSNIVTGWDVVRQTADVISGMNSLLLGDAYPNPFNGSTKLNLELFQSGKVNIDVFDIRGRLVKNLYNGMKSSGNHSIIWNASSLPSGLYFIQVTSGGHTATTKAYLTK